MKGLSVKKFLPGIAWFFITTLLCCMPGRNLPKIETWLDKIYFDKWVHFGFFGLLAFLFMYPLAGASLPLKRKYCYILLVFLATSLWGLAIEYIQRAVGRDFDLYDWAADSVGAIAALLFTRIRLLK